MIVFPNAKINLGLQITGKRADGYHNLRTVFYPIQLSDMLEAVRADEFSFHSSGLPISGDPETNLCIRAWQKLQAAYDLPPISLYLHKIIPMGAGLGGGSSDGAFTLRLINQLFKLDCPDEQLKAFALELGSDCPFFLLNQPAYAASRGEELTQIELPQLKGKTILLANPGIHISTGWAFSQLDLSKPAPAFPDLSALPLDQWKDILLNDFEPVVFNAHPEIASIRERFYAMGATYAAMTGTGSTVYGIFDTAPADWKEQFPSHYTLLESK
ncbi:4-(cytidine 5'-diphospho)-2-C-methyl-D-erythritol kinase [Flavihumibacter cheonanensis]|uniref:4-(cytidine 5'-diphospho)-2-C-methyl-D-erythritol kinase n=1 Tax=Flavihumibacter cheonanensis TaxID=1442385 RepID=UPI001EF7AB03|nr:4-(cytidine 5'-diphospho)-2-C-methyl-D-erythritol kinase [Flavihumibacter cheonanensis]MCG7751703.1 4-(cytidine 5'-diphospho)-2-C-methyl-D-erythritol kinase [Flavihumibacter cheonanensis]